MGFFSDIVEVATLGVVDDPFGSDAAADASSQAAQVQQNATIRAAEIQRGSTQDILDATQKSQETARSDLAPFRQAGLSQLSNLGSDLEGIRALITDPTKQNEFITNNPFFDALADDAQRRIFNSSSSVGKAGAGGTAEALQNSILLLGNDLVNQNINQRQNAFSSGLNIATLGANAAAGQATATQNANQTATNAINTGSSNISNLLTQGANAQASGIVGAANANAAGNQAGINTALGIAGLALSDRNEKENITFAGKVDGIPYYFFNYKGSEKTEFGTIAQEVEHTGAVLNMGGKKYVDYSRLH